MRDVLIAVFAVTAVAAGGDSGGHGSGSGSTSSQPHISHNEYTWEENYIACRNISKAAFAAQVGAIDYTNNATFDKYVDYRCRSICPSFGHGDLKCSWDTHHALEFEGWNTAMMWGICYLGFALVMRIQIAYHRFWEGATQCHQATAKWADAIMQVFAFDEASEDAFTDAAFEFRLLILHYASLMHACALIDMRQDDHIDHRMSVNQEDPFLFQPTATATVVPAGGAGGAGGADAAEPKISTGAEYGSASARHLSVPMQAMLTTRAQ